GLGIHPESGGPHGAPIDALETLGVSTFPQMEFWARSRTHRVRDEERFFIKQGSSAAHTYGKTLVAAEGFTSIGPQWEESVWDNLKPSFDQAICAGLNRLFWHTFTSSPKEAGVPGQEYFAGTHMNPNVTWWSKAGAFTSYINRVQFLMQQGLPVSDVLVYYGDQVPNFVQWKGADPAKVLPGYDYDVIDEHALTQRVHASNGRIVLPEGTSYAVLVLPERDSISPAALKKVRELVLAGAAVAGPKPVRTTGIGDDAAVRRIAGEIWSRCGTNAREMLRARGILPDFEAPEDTDYVHRRAGGTDIYFVRNTRAEARRIEATFRVKDRAPELWHAETGVIEPAGIYQSTPDGRTKLPLWLEPNGSVAVVFRRPPAPHAVSVAPESAEAKITGTRELWTMQPGRYDVRLSTGRTVSAEVAVPAPVTIEGAWTVAFGDRAVPFDALRSWTENPDPEIHYYSGTARYRKEIEIPPAMVAAGHEPWLDLGDVREIAEVWLNGKSLGVLWREPFTVALGSAAKAGTNLLEIEVVNLWPNRLIGDASLPEALRRTHTNIAKFKANSPLMPSGLLGPVVLKAASRAPLK
ncbi:MAG: glycoside hydrolase, partial [Acidobacteria bacterium]|nr:glycoside hydrolase [Acidobacteriota bacterium]